MLTQIDNIKSGILHIKPSDPDATLCTTKANKLPSDELDTLCSQIPSEYHDYLDVFSKSKANQLPNHMSLPLTLLPLDPCLLPPSLPLHPPTLAGKDLPPVSAGKDIGY